MLLELTSIEEKGTDSSFFVYKRSLLVIVFSFLLIHHVGFKIPSLGKMYELSKVCLIGEHFSNVFSSKILIL